PALYTLSLHDALPIYRFINITGRCDTFLKHVKRLIADKRTDPACDKAWKLLHLYRLFPHSFRCLTYCLDGCITCFQTLHHFNQPHAMYRVEKMHHAKTNPSYCIRDKLPRTDLRVIRCKNGM